MNRMNQGNRGAYYIVSSSFKFVRIGNDGSFQLTSCPHDCTLFTSGTTAEEKRKQLERDYPELALRWAVRATRTHRPNEYVG